MPRMVRSDEDLKKAAKDVCYEMVMLEACLDLYRQTGDRSPLGNAVQESFLIHFRNLRDFFLRELLKPVRKSRKRNDDILASDFLKSDWTPSLDPEFEATKDQMNKCLAHLSLRASQPEARLATV